VDDFEFQAQTRAELARARLKFPNQDDLRTMVLAIMEEVGEVSEAILQGQSPSRICAELIQVAAMATRAACDCNLFETGDNYDDCA
jgi:NTP pyrophosphatase (non-canonical NTP hydrolase)